MEAKMVLIEIIKNVIMFRFVLIQGVCVCVYVCACMYWYVCVYSNVCCTYMYTCITSSLPSLYHH